MNLIAFLFQVISLSVPILVAGVVLIAGIKNRWLSRLAIPIDNGRNVFGDNKTWRGVLIYAVVGTSITWVLHLSGSNWAHPIYQSNPWVLGLSMSACYVAGELINSFIKRRLGLRPGQSTGRLQAFFDNTDGALAVGALLIIGYQVELNFLLASFFVTLALHASTDAVMRKIGLKSKQHK
ncbi:MAG: CDP-archaeol synthase [Micrococcales bacterium]